MSRLSRTCQFVLMVLGLIVCLGCGDKKPEIKLAPVSGTVKCDGKPLAQGTIYFKTIVTGAFEQLPIKDGKYEGQAAEGERRVEITSYRSTIMGTGEMKGEVQESLVSTDFNTNSKLSAEVKVGSPNTFDFDVKSK